VTTAWMFGNAGDHANAMCQLYRATRPSVAQLETLLVAMAVAAPAHKRVISIRSSTRRITRRSRAMMRRAC